jgi:regulator of protease activity HflC (stomatin/prohibitin superfamily)
MRSEGMPTPIWIGIGAAVLFVLFLIASLITGAQINAGQVGVVQNMGAIDQSQSPLSPGYHVVMPIYTHIEAISTQPQAHDFAEVQASASNLQNVYVDGKVNYQILPSQAAKVVTEGGQEAIISRVFDPAFQDYIKTVVPQYSTQDVLDSSGNVTQPGILHARDAIRGKVEKLLSATAGQYGLEVTNVFITNVHFDKAYTQAIENAAVAQQQLAQAKIDAQAKVASAEGDARANTLRQQTLTPELNNYYAIQKWDGKLPTVTSGTPLISLPAK